MPKTKQIYKKIIIMGSSGLGDAVFITPAIRTVRENFPEAWITLLYSGRGGNIFKNNKLVDNIIYGFPNDKWEEQREELIKQKYDLAIILDWQPIFRSLAFSVGIKNLWSITKDDELPMPGTFNSFYNSNGNNYIFVKKNRFNRHLGEASLDLLREAGLNIISKDTELITDTEDNRFCDSLFKGLRIYPSDKIVIIHPGVAKTNHPGIKNFISKAKLILKGKDLSLFDSRCWPTAKYAELVNYMVDKLAVKVVITGGFYESGIANKISKLSHHPVMNLAGKTSLGQLISLIKRSSLLISGDTGPLHIAMALNVPVVGIYGPTIPSRTGPWGDIDLFSVVKSGLDCSPCIETENKKKCKVAQCMKSISVEEVFSAAKARLKNYKNDDLGKRKN